MEKRPNTKRKKQKNAMNLVKKKKLVVTDLPI